MTSPATPPPAPHAAQTATPAPAWRRALWVAAGLGLALVLLVVGYLAFKPLRARQLAAQALQLLEKNQLGQARQKVMAAKELSGSSLEVARAMARVWGRITPTQVVPMWERAAELSKGAKEDKQSLALALMAAGELERARALVQELNKTATNDPETTFIHANWLAGTNRVSEAFGKVAALVASHPTNENYWKLYAALAPLMGEKGLASYTAELQKLKTQRGPMGLWALEELCRLSDPKDIEKRLAELMQHPDASRASKLFAAQMRHQKAGLSYLEIRKSLEREFNLAQKAERQELARFYRSMGDNEGVLALISARMAAADKADLMLHLDALAGTGKWQALLEILDLEKLPLETYWREIFKARAWGELKQEEKSQLAWRRALVAAGSNSKALSDIAYYLITLGALQEVDEVMPRLIQNAPALERTLHYQLWLQVATQMRDTLRAQKILAQMAKEYPNNPSIKNDYLYYSLLLNNKNNIENNNKNDDKSTTDWVKEAYQLAKDNPGVLAHRMTLALALLRTGQKAAAMEVINSTKIADWSLMPPGWQLIRAAVLRVNGQEAPQVAGRQQALIEEQALIK